MPRQIEVPRLWTPSYKSGYARSAGESANPGLWKGLVGAWVPSLGPTGGTLRDVSGSGFHGTLNANMNPSTDWVITDQGYALDFTGITKLVSATINDRLKFQGANESFTISTHVYINAIDSYQGLFRVSDSNGDEWRVIIWYNELIRFDVGTKNGYSSTTVAAGKWYHIAAVADKNGTAKIYIDGEIDGTPFALSNEVLDLTTNTLVIGANSTAGQFSLEGKLGPSCIFGRAITPNEVHQLYRDPLAPFRLKPLTIAIPDAAPATFQSAWAANSNAIIQGGVTI